MQVVMGNAGEKSLNLATSSRLGRAMKFSHINQDNHDPRPPKIMYDTTLAHTAGHSTTCRTPPMGH